VQPRTADAGYFARRGRARVAPRASFRLRAFALRAGLAVADLRVAFFAVLPPFFFAAAVFFAAAFFAAGFVLEDLTTRARFTSRDFEPAWADVRLGAAGRFGGRGLEVATVIFDAGKGWASAADSMRSNTSSSSPSPATTRSKPLEA
jgi:hypothetical protein